MAARRLEGPEALARLDIDARRWRCRHRPALARVEGAGLDPRLEVLDHAPGQLTLGRHLQLVVAQRLEQQALARVARHDRRPALAPLADAVARIQQQAALDLLRPGRMAAVAVL